MVAVEQAQRQRLAVRGGKRGDAGVDGPAVGHERHAPVLGPAVLGDVQPGQDLDPVHHTGGYRRGEVEDVVHDPVDAQAEAEPAVARFDVHIRGTLGYGPVEEVLDEARHLDVVLGRVFDAGGHRSAGLGGTLCHVDRRARREGPIESSAELARAGDDGVHLGACHYLGVVEGEHVGGIGDGHQEAWCRRTRPGGRRGAGRSSGGGARWPWDRVATRPGRGRGDRRCRPGRGSAPPRR